ncbi:MAG: pyridoxal phosphate-dependent aminotransferase [Syntrophales bacterium]
MINAISKRAQDIPPFIVMDVLEEAQRMERNGTDIVHLEVGEPDFDTPDCIKEAGMRAMRDGQTHYTHSLGLIELREAICEHYLAAYGVAISPDQVLVASGTSPAMMVLFSALLEKESEIIISDPHYPCYPNMISFFGGSPVSVPVYEEDGFQLSADAIRKKMTDRTSLLMINSPSNPTGNILCEKRLTEIAGLDIPIISDEIYHGLVYEGKERSILEFTENAFVLNGFSKAYAMTGWRLGYLIVPPDYVRPMQKIIQNLFISANAFVQWAGVAALREAGPEVIRMREIYDQRRKYITGRLSDMGLGISVAPTGAFYILGNIKKYSNDSYKMAFDILKRAHVGVAPGIDFGQNCEGYLRFSYASSIENIREGMDRLQKYLRDQY